jgi:hypothetical protein
MKRPGSASWSAAWLQANWPDDFSVNTPRENKVCQHGVQRILVASGHRG